MSLAPANSNASSLAHPNLPAVAPASTSAPPSSPAPLLGDGGGCAPFDATTVVTCELPVAACQQISDLDLRLVDALAGHAVGRIGERFYARLTRPADADEARLCGWGSDEYDAICDLAAQLEDLWGSRRRKPLVLTPVPPRFRGRRADNDVELEVVR